MVSWRRVCCAAATVTGAVLGVLAVLLLVAVIRAATLQDLDYQAEGVDPGPRHDLPQWYLKDLPQLYARAIAIPTVSTEPGQYDTEQLLRFHDFLRDSFPHVFNSSFVHVELVNTYSLLFTVQGSEEDRLPYLLMAHMDVVPADAPKWTHPPFSGRIEPDPVTGEPYIWGRGAIDDKIGVMGIMMALEYLCMTDFQPSRPFFVAFGHDEEVSGYDGAAHIARLLAQRDVQLDFLLDEGLCVLDGFLPGVSTPIAAIGVTEKGWARVKVEVEGEGGHSSMPPANSAVSRLAAALVNLERYQQPSQFGRGPEVDLFSYLAPKVPWPHKLVFANLWLFGPLMELVMSRRRETNALIRTTTSVTIVRAGIKENVVPASGSAIVNHRVHPGQTIDDVLRHDRYVINDPTVMVTVDSVRDPHPVSPYGPDVPAWRLLSTAIHHHFPDAVTVPGMMVGNTDTIFYLNLTRVVYRHFPIRVTPAEIATVHGHNERIPAQAVPTAASFFHHLVLAADRQPAAFFTRPGRQAGEL